MANVLAARLAGLVTSPYVDTTTADPRAIIKLLLLLALALRATLRVASLEPGAAKWAMQWLRSKLTAHATQGQHPLFVFCEAPASPSAAPSWRLSFLVLLEGSALRAPWGGTGTGLPMRTAFRKEISP